MGLWNTLFGSGDDVTGSMVRELVDMHESANRNLADYRIRTARQVEERRCVKLNAPRHLHNFINRMRNKPCDPVDLLMLAKLYAVRFIVDGYEPTLVSNPERWPAVREILAEAVRQSSLILDFERTPYGKDLGCKAVRAYFADHIVLSVLGEAHRLRVID